VQLEWYSSCMFSILLWIANPIRTEFNIYIFFYFDRFEPARVRDGYKIINNNIILYYIRAYGLPPHHCCLNIFPFDAIAYSLRGLFFTTALRSPIPTRSNVFWLRWASKTFCFVMHLNTFIFPSYIFHLSAFLYSYNISICWYIYISIITIDQSYQVLLCLCTVVLQKFHHETLLFIFFLNFFFLVYIINIFN